MIIRPQALTKTSFKAFGEVIDIDHAEAELINAGNTQKFGDLASISPGTSGMTQVSIYRSKAVELPFKIELLERHPLGSQMFYPLHSRPFPVVVSLADATPSPDSIRVFLSNGQQGINLHANVWHHYQITLDQESDYIVIDRNGPGLNYQEHRLTGDVFLQL
jgi:ureidoglycolate lyase